MTRGPWNSGAEELDDDRASPERPMPTLVSLHFIRTTLRQRLGVCVLFAVVGLVGAGVFILAFPPPHQAKAALVLTHEPQVDPFRAMATNVSLLETRTVATKTTERLGLTMTPEDFHKTVKVEPVGSELLTLTLTAPTDAEAVRRLNGLASTYLEFRGEQLSLQSRILIDSMRDRIEQLERDVESLSEQIEQLSAAGPSATSKLSDTISQRAYIQGRIETLQQSVEDATLRNSAVVLSSRVLDPPAAQPGLAKRSIVLALASGLIGGAALGCGTVLFLAITSDRLRRRADVAAALGAPVTVSVGRIAALHRGWLWLPPLRAVNRRRTDERQRLAHAIEQELLLPQQRGRLAVAGIDNADEVSFAVAAAASAVAARGTSISLISLTDHLNRGLRTARSTPGSSAVPTVLRPRGVPGLAYGTADLLAVGHWDEGEKTPSPELAELTLVLADLDPAVGADHLTAWADRVVVVVTAGHSSAERVRTVGELIRLAGLDLRFAVLMHAERTDDSLGMAEVERPTPLQVRDGHERPESTGASEVR